MIHSMKPTLPLLTALTLLAPLAALHAADAPPLSGGTNAVRELTIEHPYLHLPVKHGAPERRVRFVVDGKLVRDLAIKLAEGEPDFQVFSEVSAFKGQKLRIEVDNLPKPAMLDAIVAADEVPGAGGMYQEKYRPQFHFSPRRGWVGDPNGLVFYKGEYHLFFQLNPYGLTCSAFPNGNDHWGHAVSKDLIHWLELPITLYPFQFGDWPFSGSCVVDKANTAGFKTGSEDPLVIVYPSTRRGICLAYSNDRGRTFTPYAGNPIPPRDMGGDPRVFWHAPTKQWVMLTCKILKKDPAFPPGSPGWLGKTLCGFEFFASPDLKNWERQSGIEDYWECPDLFELPVDGEPSHTKWILLPNQVPSISAEGKGKHPGGRYVIGTFDGKRFTTETGKLQLSFGNAYGAAQSYNDIPAEDGRRINVGCAFGAHMPGMPFEQMMNFPTELTLRTTEEGPRLFTQPVREIKALYASTRKMDDVVATPEGTVLPGVEGDLFDIAGEFAVGAESEEVGFKVRGVPITYHVKACQLTCGDPLTFRNRNTAPLKPVDGKIKIRFLLDRASIEIFGNDGRVYMPMAVIPKDEDRSIAVFAKGAGAKVTGLTVHTLKSACLK